MKPGATEHPAPGARGQLTLEAVATLREGWDFEAKRATGRDGSGAVPASFWETYSAMANTEGGIIVLGAFEREDGSLDVGGVPDIDKLERELWNNLENRKKVSANVLSRGGVNRLAVDERTALVVEVPKAPRALRPVYVNGSWERGTYLRVHEGDRAATTEVARRMLADAQPDHDAQIVEEYGVQDLHAESLRRYRQVFASKRPDHPFVAEADSEFLHSVGVLRRDRVRRVEGLTLGGLLMLGREEALRNHFPHWHLSYRELPGAASSGKRWLDRISPDGTWNANVFEFYSRVIGKLHEGLKVPFALDDQQHRRDETPAHEALREALVNTLVHADYQGPSGIRVVRDPSGYEFRNPGLLLVAAEQVWRGGISESRNPTLQRLFGLLQLGEREGSGGPAIRQGWEQQHWRAPSLEQDVEHGETRLELRQVSLLADGAVEAARTALGTRFDDLDELERLVVITACNEGAVDHARLRMISSAHPRDLTLALHGLVRRRVLVRAGRGKSTRYSLATGSERTAGGFEQTSEQTSERIVRGSEQRGTRGWSAHDRQLAAVLAFCATAWRTLPEIAVALDRAESTVRTKYLAPLIEDGRLERLHPDSPRHPHQAYRTAATVQR